MILAQFGSVHLSAILKRFSSSDTHEVLLKAQYWPLCLALLASVVVLVFMGARRPLLLKSSIMATNESLRIFNITKMAAKTSQRAMLSGQYEVFNYSFAMHYRAIGKLVLALCICCPKMVKSSLFCVKTKI